MASFLPYSLLFFSLFSSSLIFHDSINGVFVDGFLSDAVPLNKTEKLSHFHFYFHDILSGKTPSAIQIIGPPKLESGNGLFGKTFMIDDALTVGRDPKSKIVGKAQGLYSIATQEEVALLMVMNFIFTQGKYNGSSLSVLGRNPVFDNVREFPIVGGTGLFRFARGYALAHTVWLDAKTGDAVVEYNVYVLHY